VTKRPLVSIGLPVYNGERFLGAALESIVSQSWADLEVVVSDNASTDRTPEICSAFASRDPRVHYRRNPHNLGAAPN
jgi:glycosyltransferase involved in cell wall biosynthesis